MTDDDSPIFRRVGRNTRKVPVIPPSPDTPSVQIPVPSKLAVPPSPNSSSSQHGVGDRWNSARQKASRKAGRDKGASKRQQAVRKEGRKRGASRRQQRLKNPFFEHQAKEGNEGSTVDGSSNSDDDGSLSNLSYVTDG